MNMQKTVGKFFAPPIFEGDDEKTRVAGLLNSTLLFVILATSGALPAMAVTTETVNLLPLFLLVVPFLAINIVAYLILRRGNVLVASYIFLITLSIGIFGSYTVSAPQSIGATLSLIILIAFTALLLDARAIIGLLVLITALTLVVTTAHDRGWISPLFVVDTNPISNWITISLIFAFTGWGLVRASNSLRRALDSSRASQENLEKSNRELDGLRKELEQRVGERTTDLERRATQLEAVSSVARTIASVQDVNTLLPNITKLVSRQFGFYHVGIFLVDDANEFAVLRAANSEGGERMLNRRHQLRLDSNSIVGFSVSRGEPRIALDVGTDSVYFNNPDLPETRSEMALPLRVGGRVIGALDVQSTKPNAFTQEDISVITTLADQVAIAIENARLFAASQNALLESQDTFDKYVNREWSSFTRQAKHTGFVFDGKQVTPLDHDAKFESSEMTSRTGGLTPGKSSSMITIPLKLRGQTIGVLDVRSRKGQREWTQDEVTLLETAAERAALALENARLVESAQRRASRERAIGEISSKIGTFSDVDAILQAAVEELGRRIGGAAEVTIELGEDDRKTVE